MFPPRMVKHAGSESEIKTQGTWGKPCFTLWFPCFSTAWLAAGSMVKETILQEKRECMRAPHWKQDYDRISSASQTPELGHGEQREWVILGQEQSSSCNCSDLNSPLGVGKPKRERTQECSVPSHSPGEIERQALHSGGRITAFRQRCGPTGSGRLPVRSFPGRGDTINPKVENTVFPAPLPGSQCPPRASTG